ncbi:MAG: carbohydrate ABC transporter permease [Bacillota bacterium]
MLPGLLLVLAFVLYPLVRGVQMSLYNWNLMEPSQSEFLGLANYRRALAEDPIFWLAVRNTGLYVVVTVPLQMALGLFTALLLNGPIRGKVLFRTLYYLPVVTSWLVVSYIFAYLFSSGPGPVNYVLTQVFHFLPEPVDWLQNTWTAQVPINLLGIWKGIGWNMVIFLAALQTIPQEIYEAASVDGASPWQTLWGITLPLLRPTLTFITVMLIIGGFNVFLSVFLLTGGGPMGMTEVWLSYMYTQAFKYLDFGYGTAIGLLMGVTVAVISFAQRRFLRGAGVQY